ncbi:MAG: cell division protein SepF [Candidatus Bathyarchaeota archaeon]|nr:cell division protein SepF [Candidatus Bathyarchaeota archaeon]
MSGLLDRLVGKNGEERDLQTARYIKAIPLRAYEDIDIIKAEVRAGNIVICNVAPLAKHNIEDVKRGINELNEYAQVIEGDIARLGEERVIITPKTIRIWRAKD